MPYLPAFIAPTRYLDAAAALAQVPPFREDGSLSVTKVADAIKKYGIHADRIYDLYA